MKLAMTLSYSGGFKAAVGPDAVQAIETLRDIVDDATGRNS